MTSRKTLKMSALALAVHSTQALAVPTASSRSYKASVVQVSNGYTIEKIEQYTAAAKEEGAELVIFPENGPPGDDCDIPNPGHTVAPCTAWPKVDENLDLCDPNKSNDLISEAACIAKNNEVYLAFNTGDRQECLKSPDTGLIDPALCPKAGHLAFNTEVVLAPNGALVAKYYKQFLFSDTKTQPTSAMISPEDPLGPYGTKSTFTAKFKDGSNVNFGLAVCNDINSASTIKSYRQKGINDLIVSDNWHNAYSLQTISSISTGFTMTYGFNMLVASAADQAGGSGIFSQGRVLASAPLAIMTNVTKQGSVYECIHKETGKFGPAQGCMGQMRTAAVPILAAPERRRMLDLSTSEQTLRNLTAAAPWPVHQATAKALALPLPEYASQTHLLPGAVYPDPNAPEAQALIKVVGNVGDATILEMPSAPGTYSFTSPSINGMSCKVTAEVGALATGPTEYFKVLAVNSDVYAPDVPCPFQWNVCSISRCTEFDEWGLCRGGPLNGRDPSTLTKLDGLRVELVTTQASVVTPLISGLNLQPLSVDSLTTSGPWREYQTPPASATYSMTLSKEMLNTQMGFSSATILANGAADPHAKCNLCVNPDNFWDVRGTVIPWEMTDLRSKFCTHHWFGSGGPDPNWPPTVSFN